MSSSIIGGSHTEIHPTTEEESSCMAMCLATWSVPSMVFKTVLELNVIDIIYAAGPKAQLSAEEIVAQLPTTNPNAAVALDRMLRLLASFTILTCTQSVQSDGSPKRLLLEIRLVSKGRTYLICRGVIGITVLKSNLPRTRTRGLTAIDPQDYTTPA
ncbi:Caffeic acid 3-O-methyltransferase [Bienertia sinuspersici]